jgi:cbb3-type cytochrome oxidase subunit 1
MVVHSVLLGIIVALKFHWPDLLGDTSWLACGRLRYGHILGVWIFFPGLRAWMEMPKYRFLEQQRQSLDVFRDPQPRREEPSQRDRRRPEASTST